MVENLTEEVLGDSLEANVGRRQVDVQPSQTGIIFPSSPVGIVMNSEEHLSLPLDHNFFPFTVVATIPLLREIRLPLEDEVGVGALAGEGPDESLQLDFGGSFDTNPIEQTSELELSLQQLYKLHQTWIAAEITQRVEEQVAKERTKIQMNIVKEIYIGKKAFEDAVFKRDVLKEAQR